MVLEIFVQGNEVQVDKDTRRFLTKLMEKISQYCVSESTKSLFQKVVPTWDAEIIKNRQNSFSTYFEKLQKIDTSKLEDSLKKAISIKFSFSRATDRVIITDNLEDFKKLKETITVCPIKLVSSETEIKEALASYDLVLYHFKEGLMSYDERMIPLEGFDDVYVVPEQLVKQIQDNKEGLAALSSLCITFSDLLNDLKPEEIIAIIEEGSVTIDKNILERESLLGRASDIVEEIIREVNDSISKRAKELEIKLKGTDILEVYLRGPEGLLEITKGIEELQNIIEEEVIKGEEKIVETLQFGEGVLKRSYPVEINVEVFDESLRNAIRDLKIIKYSSALNFVKKHYSKLISIKTLLEKLFIIDFYFATFKFFTNTKHWCYPTIFEGGIGFIEAVYPFIENPQPVSYLLGKIPEFSPIRPKESSVTLLTGANSGGKTTLLETLLMIQLLSQSGFPVPAKTAWFEPVQIIRFYRGSRKLATAGAFESTLKSLVGMITKRGKKLILIDELAESITEPGAAALIISEIIKILKDQKDFCVLVTHLGDDVISRVPDIRVDGIEASGLDEDFRLIVDRQPRFGIIGKSTPELIVKKLVNTERNKHKREIYERLLKSLTQHR